MILFVDFLFRATKILCYSQIFSLKKIFSQTAKGRLRSSILSKDSFKNVRKTQNLSQSGSSTFSKTCLGDFLFLYHTHENVLVNLKSSVLTLKKWNSSESQKSSQMYSRFGTLSATMASAWNCTEQWQLYSSNSVR